MRAQVCIMMLGSGDGCKRTNNGNDPFIWCPAHMYLRLTVNISQISH